jgi:hypoxanthine phosphoribosyltransferase
LKTTITRPAREQSDPIRLFYSYSHEDEKLRKELEVHLASLKQKGLIQPWHDREISAGQNWEKVIDKNLEAADVILLLISPHFLASTYCYGVEMKRALERHELRDARVIPIIIKPANWTEAPIGELQALPSNAKPIDSWRKRAEGWTHVAEGIGIVIRELIDERLKDREKLDNIKQKPGRFEKEVLSVEDMRTGAGILYGLVQSKVNFQPDVLIGVNQGGTVTAALMNQHWGKPVGTVYTAVTEDRRVVKYVSLPFEVESRSSPKGGNKKMKPKRILVVDTKLKTAESAEGIEAFLRREYGPDIKIRYAVVLAYGGWSPERWRVIHSAPFEWPIQFRPKKLEAYVAYYTDCDPERDNIKEQGRPG